MALGKDHTLSDSLSPDSSQEKRDGFGQDAYYGDFAQQQSTAEEGGKKARKMNRIDGPVTKSISGEAGRDSDTDTSVSV